MANNMSTSLALQTQDFKDTFLSVPVDAGFIAAVAAMLEQNGYVIIRREEVEKLSKTAEEQSLELPFWRKFNLTVSEASEYSSIGECTLRHLLEDENCPFVLRVGTKVLVKRLAFEEFLNNAYSIASCKSALC